MYNKLDARVFQLEQTVKKQSQIISALLEKTAKDTLKEAEIDG